MPLPDAPWENGKCGYKLIQYMASGRPVIASAVGVNTDIEDIADVSISDSVVVKAFFIIFNDINFFTM